LRDADEEMLARVRRLYEAVDPPLASKLNEALDARAIAGDAANGAMGGAQQQVTPLVNAAARFLKSPDGPRIAVIDVGGWDTHANQGGAQGNLAQRLKGLDAGIQTLKTELGPVWADTTVLVVTEFGRTVAVNGTRGTDHGTAGIALLAGGGIKGGRVVSDWPGLAARDLYENRDLKPTTDLRRVFKSVLAERFGLTEAALERAVFPDSAGATPLQHLTA
jgi:uncharacterized protein (DUF1501 family)